MTCKDSQKLKCDGICDRKRCFSRAKVEMISTGICDPSPNWLVCKERPLRPKCIMGRLMTL